MKTVDELVEGKMQVWAIPDKYPDEGEPPFRYVVRDNIGSPYQDGAVMVKEQDVTIRVPAGIDLLEKAIETLKGEIKTTRADAEVRVNNLQEQINNLLLLEHKTGA